MRKSCWKKLAFGTEFWIASVKWVSSLFISDHCFYIRIHSVTRLSISWIAEWKFAWLCQSFALLLQFKPFCWTRSTEKYFSTWNLQIFGFSVRSGHWAWIWKTGYFLNVLAVRLGFVFVFKVGLRWPRKFKFQRIFSLNLGKWILIPEFRHICHNLDSMEHSRYVTRFEGQNQEWSVHYQWAYHQTGRTSIEEVEGFWKINGFDFWEIHSKTLFY